MKETSLIETGTWQLPGGHLEHGESVLVCAEREVLEETGLKVQGVKIVAVTNDVFEEAGKHYITLFVHCEMEDKAAEPQVRRDTGIGTRTELTFPRCWSLKSVRDGTGRHGRI